MNPSERDTFRNGIIPELEQIHDAERDLDRRDALWKAIGIVEEHFRRHVAGRVRSLTAGEDQEQAEPV